MIARLNPAYSIVVGFHDPPRPWYVATLNRLQMSHSVWFSNSPIAGTSNHSSRQEIPFHTSICHGGDFPARVGRTCFGNESAVPPRPLLNPRRHLLQLDAFDAWANSSLPPQIWRCWYPDRPINDSAARRGPRAVPTMPVGCLPTHSGKTQGSQSCSCRRTPHGSYAPCGVLVFLGRIGKRHPGRSYTARGSGCPLFGFVV